MALFASARQTRSQTEGAGREKFAYQAALNINITRLRRGGDKYMRRGGGGEQQHSQPQVLECEMKLCKAGDEDNGSRTRTKI